MDERISLFRHLLATLAYRAGKVLRDAPPAFAAFRVDATSRTPAEILAHMGDLFDWSLALADGRHVWHDSQPLEWDAEVTRFFRVLQAFDARVTSGDPVQAPLERLIQGPVADALTHVGQLAMLRRMSGAAMRGENYYVAQVAAGTIGLAQAAPVQEF